MKNINESELRNYIFKKLQESYFDDLKFDDKAMKAAMSDINASGEEFEELGASKFEKDPKFKEKFTAALNRANLDLPSDKEEVEYYANVLKDRESHKKKFGVGSLIGAGSLNETEIEHIKDANGKSIKLKSQVQLKSPIGYVERFMVGDDKNMLVKVNWVGSKKAEPIVSPEEIIVKENTMMNEEAYEASRYMFFSNLQQIRRQAGLLLDLDENKIQEILENGHDWAQDHIATAKESIDQVFDFLMNETSSGDMWKSVDLEDREDQKEEDEIEEGIGHSHIIGQGANKKPVNYPEELMRESFIKEDEHHTLSFLDKIKLKLAGISEEQAIDNLNNGLPIDWTGSKEGYYDQEESRGNYSGTNEGLEEDMDKTDYPFNKAMLDYEAQEELNREFNKENPENVTYEQIIFLQDHEADHALNILKLDGKDEAMDYLIQWDNGDSVETSEDPGFGASDKTYERDGYIMAWNAPIGYISLVRISKENIEEDSQRKRHTAGQIGKVAKNIPLGQNAPHSDSAEGL